MNQNKVPSWHRNKIIVAVLHMLHCTSLQVVTPNDYWKNSGSCTKHFDQKNVSVTPKSIFEWSLKVAQNQLLDASVEKLTVRLRVGYISLEFPSEVRVASHMGLLWMLTQRVEQREESLFLKAPSVQIPHLGWNTTTANRELAGVCHSSKSPICCKSWQAKGKSNCERRREVRRDTTRRVSGETSTTIWTRNFL